MTIVNCHFEDTASQPLFGKLCVSRFVTEYDSDSINLSYEISATLVNGAASVTLTQGQYYFTAIDNNGRVAYSQRVQVPSSVSPVELSIIAATPPTTPGGSNSLKVTKLFTQSDLSIVGLLPAVHNFGSEPSNVRLLDQDGYEITPDFIKSESTNAIAISLYSATPITGTWQAILEA